MLKEIVFSSSKWGVIGALAIALILGCGSRQAQDDANNGQSRHLSDRCSPISGQTPIYRKLLAICRSQLGLSRCTYRRPVPKLISQSPIGPGGIFTIRSLAAEMLANLRQVAGGAPRTESFNNMDTF